MVGGVAAISRDRSRITQRVGDFEIVVPPNHNPHTLIDDLAPDAPTFFPARWGHREVVVHIERLRTRECAARFLDTSRSLQSFSHRNAAKLLAAGSFDTTVVYRVYEAALGTPLVELASQSPLPADVATHAILDIVDVVAALHADGVVHGRLSVASLFVHRLGDRSLGLLGELGSGRGVDSTWVADRHDIEIAAPSYGPSVDLDFTTLARIYYWSLCGRWPTRESPPPSVYMPSIPPSVDAAALFLLTLEPNAVAFLSWRSALAQACPRATESTSSFTGAVAPAGTQPQVVDDLATAPTQLAPFGNTTDKSLAKPRLRSRHIVVALVALLIFAGGVVAAVLATDGEADVQPPVVTAKSVSSDNARAVVDSQPEPEAGRATTSEPDTTNRLVTTELEADFLRLPPTQDFFLAMRVADIRKSPLTTELIDYIQSDVEFKHVLSLATHGCGFDLIADTHWFAVSFSERDKFGLLRADVDETQLALCANVGDHVSLPSGAHFFRLEKTARDGIKLPTLTTTLSDDPRWSNLYKNVDLEATLVVLADGGALADLAGDGSIQPTYVAANLWITEQFKARIRLVFSSEAQAREADKVVQQAFTEFAPIGQFTTTRDNKTLMVEVEVGEMVSKLLFKGLIEAAKQWKP